MARPRTHLCRPRALRSVAKERNRDNNLLLLARPMDIAGTSFYKILCCYCLSNSISTGYRLLSIDTYLIDVDTYPGIDAPSS